MPVLAVRKHIAPRAEPLREPLIPGDPLESYYYVHFFSTTVNDLEISACLDRKFWHKCFHSPSQESMCIRHSVIALGATHWLYRAQGCETASVQSFALGHYNQAISELIRYTHAGAGSGTHISTILTCCFLFVLVECLRGDFSEAIRHLESGCRLIVDNAPGYFSSNIHIKELAAMFHAISSQLSLFSESRLFPDLIDFVAPMKKYENFTGRLRDLDEAEDTLNSFDDILTHMSWDMEKHECGRGWEALRQQVQCWNIEFQRIAFELSGNSHDMRRIANLKIQHKLWELLMDGEPPDGDCDDSTEEEMDPAECNLILDEIEWLWSSSPQPHFGLKTDLSTAIYQLYVFCKDDAVRRRIIRILRSHQRREIAWDSLELAKFLEADMMRRDKGLQTEEWPDIGPSTSDGALLVFKPVR